MLLLTIAAAVSIGSGPVVELTADNTRVTESCVIRIPDGAVIEDLDGDGVLHIAADDVEVVFEAGAAELIGAPDGTAWDELSGIGVTVRGARNVTIRGASVHRFRVGILAERADGLRVVGADVSGGFASRLGSTVAAEDSSDWLWPHSNDNGEWASRYGGGIVIRDSSGVTVRDCVARQRQNGLLLERVVDSKIYSNDFSFLSGWGVAMWRSSRNVISRNQLDFCIRGYSDGVYNRGQDSAGLLMFEQCSENHVIENSITHGGDGVFAFGGREALGEGDAPDGFDHTRRGNNDNIFIGNDLSYAAAHGLELTFSFGNQIVQNRLVENAICGIWGGYSQDTLIASNAFAGNGERGYGLERGGINIEHGRDNVIRENTFDGDRCGVHLWWDPDEGLLKLPWAIANGGEGTGRRTPSVGNEIRGNTFQDCETGVHLRACDGTLLSGNEFRDVERPVDAEPGSEPVRRPAMPSSYAWPIVEPLGEPVVGLRRELRGRENIIMGTWFPWDHELPLLRQVGGWTDGLIEYELRGAPPIDHVRVEPAGAWRVATVEQAERQLVRLAPANPQGVMTYSLEIDAGAERFESAGDVFVADWKVQHFAWSSDPREDLEAWRAEAQDAPVHRRSDLRLPFGMSGPAEIGSDRFGTVARADVPLQSGRWRVATLSDDGVRVTIDGHVVLENWTWHGPTRDEGEFVVDVPGVREIVVEHFELDGYAVLEFSLERVSP